MASAGAFTFTKEVKLSPPCVLQVGPDELWREAVDPDIVAILSVFDWKLADVCQGSRGG